MGEGPDAIRDRVVAAGRPLSVTVERVGPAPTAKRITVTFKEEGPLGLSMREDDEGNSVLEEPKGKAQELGLCTGDVIVEVQGHACMGEAPARIRDRVVAAGRPLSVTVERPQ